MERYSGNQAMEGAAAADPVAEWAVPTGETGLEGGVKKWKKNEKCYKKRYTRLHF